MSKQAPQYSVVHGTFTLERHYGAPPARVFAAFADPTLKRRWFAASDSSEPIEYTLDFRVGGIERTRFIFSGTNPQGDTAARGAPPAGTIMGNDTVFQDIVPDHRIVFAYTMTVGEKRISSSLATITIVASGDGSVLTFTEQGAFFDGTDRPEIRESGWSSLLTALEKAL